MKRNLGLICLTWLFSVSVFAAESLDRIIATVNDAVITQSELDQSIAILEKQLAMTNTPIPSSKVMHKQVLDQLINKKLQLQIAEQAGVNIKEEDVTKAINQIAEQNKITTAELYTKVEADGIPRSEYRREIHDQITIQQIQHQEVGSKISITPQEVESFMRSKAFQASNTKEYHLEDILIALPDTPTPDQIAEAKKQADLALEKIRNGTNFNQIAISESGNTTALQGGDLGWRKLAEIPTAFTKKLDQLQVNQVMGPIQTPNGFHIVRLAGVRNANNQMASGDPKQQVQQLVYQRKYEEGVQNWLTRIRGTATIKTHLNG